MSADHQTLIAEALSWVSGEMTRWRDNAHPDHNRWSWKGDGHGSVIRDEFREQAAALLDSPEFAAVLADVRAGAWDEGMRTGTSRAMRLMSDEPGLPLASSVHNPYRADERTSHE